MDPAAELAKAERLERLYEADGRHDLSVALTRFAGRFLRFYHAARLSTLIERQQAALTAQLDEMEAS